MRKLSARLPPEPKEEKAEGKPVAQLRFRIPATHTRDEDMTNGEQTKNGKLFPFFCTKVIEMITYLVTFFRRWCQW